MINGKQAGIFGEIHPQVLENWQVGVPCVAGEMDLEYLMENEPKEHASAAKTQTAEKAESKPAEKPAVDEVEVFNKYVQLLVAKIEKVETNQQGDKLYIETMDDGSGTPRIVQS